MRSLGSLIVVTTCTAVWAQSTPPPGQVGQIPPLPGQTAPTPTPEKGTGAVMGQVVDARGDGVAAAIVLIQGGYRAIALTTDNREIPGGPRATLTNRTGHFAFFDLTSGTYAFDANKPGYMAGAYGRMRPGGQPQSITLKPGEHQTSIRIQMWDYGAVSGTVRDETGEPVIGVQVRALRRAMVFGQFQLTSAPAISTNDRGEYRIDNLPPGRYAIVVASTQTSLPLAEIEARAANAGAPTDVQMQLMRAGLSSTASGREVSGWLWNSGSRSAMTVPNPTDDGRLSVYPTTFYPSARSSRDAELITLEPGRERMAVDFQMQLVPATMVSGTITDAEGPLPGLAVKLVPEYADELAGDLRGLETAGTVTDSNGRFLFAGVPIGQYYVQAEAAPAIPTGPGAPAPAAPPRRGWLNERLAVGEGGVAGATFTLRPIVRVSGQISFDGTKPIPPPELIERFVVSLETIGFAVNRVEAPYQANFDRNGQFVFPAVPPGPYVLVFRAAIADRRAMPDWETKGASLQGRDLSDRPMTITGDMSGILMILTDHNSELSGSVRDASGKIDPTAAVLLFTAEKELWPIRMVRRIRNLRASETGAYSVRGVPAGDYFLLAIPDADVGDFPDPAMLDTLSRMATRITMASGERKMQDLVVKPIK